MLEFNEIKCDVFKKQSLSMQLLYMFQDSLRMLNHLYGKEKKVVPQVCELSSDRFIVRLRVYDMDSLGYPVVWFSEQYHAFRSVRPKSFSRVDVEPTIGHPSYIDVSYSVWLDSPIPF